MEKNCRENIVGFLGFQHPPKKEFHKDIQQFAKEKTEYEMTFVSKNMEVYNEAHSFNCVIPPSFMPFSDKETQEYIEIGAAIMKGIFLKNLADTFFTLNITNTLPKARKRK